MKSHSTPLVVIAAAVGLAAVVVALFLPAPSEATLLSERKTCSDEWSRCTDDPEVDGPGIPFDKCSGR